MAGIMRQHLLPAGYEFQKVLDDFERLQAGQQLVDEDVLAQAEASEDNNRRHDLLNSFVEIVLPQLDSPADEVSAIRGALVRIVARARETPAADLDTPFGDIAGFTVERIVEQTTDALNQLRYIDPVGGFFTLLELFPGSASDEERKFILRSVRLLAQNNLNVWRQFGPAVQKMLIEAIAEVDLSSTRITSVLLEALSGILDPQTEATSSDYKSITIRQGAVVASEDLLKIRAAAIDLLKRLYRQSVTSPEAAEIERALFVATETPTMGAYNDTLLGLVLQNSADVVQFFVSMKPELPYASLAKVEQRVLHLHQRNFDIRDNAELAEARESLAQAIAAFRTAALTDREFTIYKTFVGFDVVFEPSWDDPRFVYSAMNDYRAALAEDYFKNLSDETSDIWLQRLQRCAATKSDDLATFSSFGEFLQRIGAEQPKIALQWLSQLGEMEPFLPALLHGLGRGSGREDAHAVIERWITEQAHLWGIGHYLSRSPDVDSGLLWRFYYANAAASDVNAINKVVEACFEWSERTDFDAAGLLTDAVSSLTEADNCAWSRNVWIRKTETLLSKLSQEQARILLVNIALNERIGHATERIIAGIAKFHPEVVLEMFDARLRVERRKVGDRYEALPFNPHELRRTFSERPHAVFDWARSLARDDDPGVRLRGLHFVQEIFSKPPNAFLDLVAEAAATGNRDDLIFACAVLREYHGQLELHPICRVVVSHLEEEDPLLGEIRIVLQATGVVSGEFGFVEAYEQKKLEMAPWLEDPNPRVVAFSERYRRLLDNSIASETRRAQQGIEMRKHQFGGDDDSVIDIDDER